MKADTEKLETSLQNADSEPPRLQPTHSRLTKYQGKMGEHLERINMQLDEEIAELRRHLKENKAAISTGHEKKKSLEKEINKLANDYQTAEQKTLEAKEKLQKAHENNAVLTVKVRQMQERQLQATSKKNQTRQRLDAIVAKLADAKRTMENKEGVKGAKNGKKASPARGKPEGNAEKKMDKKEEPSAGGRKATEASDTQKLESEKNGDIASANANLVKLTATLEELRKKNASLAEKLSRQGHGTKHKEGMENGEKLKLHREEAEKRSKSMEALKKTIAEKTAYLEELNGSLVEARERLHRETAEIERIHSSVKRQKTANSEMRKSYENLKKRKAGKSRGQTKDSLATRDSSLLSFEKMERELNAHEHNNDVNTKPTNGSRRTSSKTPKTGKSEVTEIRELSSVSGTPSIDTPGSIDSPRKSASKMKTELRNLNRQKSAIQHSRQRIAKEAQKKQQQLDTLAEEVAELQKELTEVVKVREELEKGLRHLSEGGLNDSTSDRVKGENEKKRDELLRENTELRERLEIEKKRLENAEKSADELEREIQSIGVIDIDSLEKERTEKAIELRRLKNYYHDLQKSLREKQKELEFTVVQRDDSVDRANATVNLTTTVRTHRLQQIEALREQVAKREKELQELHSPSPSNSQ